MSAKPSILNIFLLLSITFSHCVCRAEYFSSVDSLQELVEIETRMVKEFYQYIDVQEQILANYNEFLEYVKSQRQLIQRDVAEYLGNPINAVKLINRMATDWIQLRISMRKNSEKNVLRQTYQQIKFSIPDYADLRGTVMAVVRLQKMYKLKTSDLANGVLNGIDYGNALDWQESNKIAEILFKEKEWLFAISWFKATFKNLKRETFNTKNANFQINLLSQMALAYLEIGSPEEATRCIYKLLKISTRLTGEESLGIEEPQNTKLNAFDITKEFSFSNHSRLCQGKQLPEKVHQTLKCRLETKNSPVFVLAPLKKEEISLDPEIVMYHGILNDAQIDEILLSAAGMQMARSEIESDANEHISDFRVSQQTWLDDDLPIKKKINLLLSEITGFNMNNSEPIQVVDYASGGVYEPHVDNLGEYIRNYDEWSGDRISTNIFYLSDVEQGGYTAFPNVNVFLRPEKGSLAIWYNMHRSLDEDKRLLHAGCPVIKGSKRIANVWIHSGHQEFARPCELINDAFKSKPYQSDYYRSND